MQFAKKKIALLYLALVISLVTIARSNVIPGTGRSAGMGNAFVSLDGIDASLNNQAGLSSLNTINLSVFFENRFLLKELSTRGISVGIPTRSGVFATNLYLFGPAKWAETTFSFAYANQLTPKLSGAVQLNYFGMKLPEENQSLSSVGAELGFIYRFSPTLSAGIHLANPFTLPFQTINYSETIPWRIRAGGHALISERIIISAEAEKTGRTPLLLKAGLEWEAADHFFVRGGYNSGPSKLFAGIGFTYRFLIADLAFGYHQTLGVTPSFTIKFSIQ